ncbi:MAG: PAS domain S-box protein [Candidatus Nitrotoga sp.]
MNEQKKKYGINRDIADSHQAKIRELYSRRILDSTHDMIVAFAPDTLQFMYANEGAIKATGYDPEMMLRMTPMNIVPMISEMECRAFLAPLVSGKKLTRCFETILQRLDGRIFPAEVQIQFIQEEGNAGLFVAIARNIAKRKFAEMELRKQKNLMWQVIDLDPNIIFVKDAAGKFLLANQATANLCGMPIQSLIGRTCSGINSYPHQVPGFFTAGCDEITSNQDVVSTESALLPDGNQHWYIVVKRPMLQADGSVNTLVIGVDISALKLSETELSASYKELQRLAMHLENVRAEERLQIARNLHDEMGATLAALKMRVAWLASNLPEGMLQLDTEVTHISELVSDGIGIVRQVVSDLRPNLLDDEGLVAAIKDYVKRFQRDTEIRCTVVLPEREFVLDENQSVTLFRILQESLNNISKHAQASTANILFAIQDDSLMLQIEDNGTGFDLGKKKQSFGLLGIRERALMGGGNATIESKPGWGTRVSVNIPLNRKTN